MANLESDAMSLAEALKAKAKRFREMAETADAQAKELEADASCERCNAMFYRDQASRYEAAQNALVPEGAQ